MDLFPKPPSILQTISELDQWPGFVRKEFEERAINVKWFGAKCDGVTDDTNAINTAIASLKDGGIILFPQGATLKISSSIITNAGITLLGDKTVIDASSIPPGTPTVIINPSTIGGPNPRNVLKGIIFKGHVNPADNVYTPNSICLQINTSQIIINNCAFMGYDIPTDFRSNSYLIYFLDCISYYNNYGIYLDNTGKTNLGAAIHWFRGIIAHCIYGLYNKMFEINFYSTAFDSILQSYVNDNITSEGGVHTTITNFIACRFEVCYGPNQSFKNSGYMKFNDCFFREPNTANIVFENTGYIQIDGGLWRLSDNIYRATGTGEIKVVRLNPLSCIKGIRLSPKESRILNSDFEKGDMTGWLQELSTSSYVTNSTANTGIYSLAVVNTTNVGNRVLSYPILLDNQAKFFHLGFFSKNLNPVAVYPYITFYDIKNNKLFDALTTIQPNEPAFTYHYISDKIPVNANYAQISITVGNTQNNICYFDDFYLTLY